MVAFTQKFQVLPQGQVITDLDTLMPSTTLQSLVDNPVYVDHGQQADIDAGALVSIDATTVVVRNLVAGATLAAKDVVGLSGGRVVLADADTGPVAAIGVCVKAASAGGLTDVAIAGLVVATGLTANTDQWLSTTAGDTTETENVTSTQLKQKLGTSTANTTEYKLQMTDGGTVNS